MNDKKTIILYAVITGLILMFSVFFFIREMKSNDHKCPLCGCKEKGLL